MKKLKWKNIDPRSMRACAQAALTADLTKPPKGGTNMKRKNLFALLILAAVLVMALAGCGADDEVPEATTAAAPTTTLPSSGPLDLEAWSMNATTWSSPNGATINLTATPTVYAEGQSAEFVVRLEGEDIAGKICDWDGAYYTASVELTAADGYCYYVILTAADGTKTEVAVNTPTAPIDETLINMASSLNAYCNLMVENAETGDGKLTITQGYAQIQMPQITQDGTVTCTEAVLVLTMNGQEIAREALSLPEPGATGSYEADITGISFQIPDMEDEQQLDLRLDATLSNGHAVTAPGGSWTFADGEQYLTVG